MIGERGPIPRVAVVVPTHNRDEMLAEALSSIVVQTLPPAELVVVDDLDRAATRALVDDTVLPSGAPVRYLFNRGRSGAPSSRNLGAASTSCPLIAFLDDDDRWRPEFLASCAAALAEDTDASFAVTWCAKFWDGGTKPSMRIPPDTTYRDALVRNPGFSGQNFVIRREAFEAVGGFDPEAPRKQDWDLFVRLLGAGLRYAVVPQELVDIRLHGGARVSSDDPARELEGKRYFFRKHAHAMTPRQRLQWRGVFARHQAQLESSPTVTRIAARLTAAAIRTLVGMP